MSIKVFNKSFFLKYFKITTGYTMRYMFYFSKSGSDFFKQVFIRFYRILVEIGY